MNEEQLRELLTRVASGALSPEAALERLRVMPFEDLGFAKLDHHRALRKGFPEVIFCSGKTPEQVVTLVERLRQTAPCVLGTRASEEIYKAVAARVPKTQYVPTARCLLIGEKPTPPPGCSSVLVVTAGTADLPIAEEAAIVAEACGAPVERLFDVGVAGLHRLLAHYEQLRRAGVIIVVAGMEGALPSVIGGLVAAPVIAVPTSVGYGAHLGGLAPLLTMLNSCAPGIAVVNIDNGFGAGYLAALIVKMAAAKSE